jgi:hypothetical protein
MKSEVRLSREALEEFKTIYREEFGEDISDDKAGEMGMRLLRLFDILSHPTARDATDQSSRSIL